MTQFPKGTLENPVRVLIVDDSALFRRLLSKILGADGTIEVVGTAADAHSARAQIKTLNPDVLTLDVEMGGMDGITFLSHLMRLRPMPVVMISSMTAVGAKVTLDALALGAVDVVSKPKVNITAAFEDGAQQLRDTVTAASRSSVRRLIPGQGTGAATPTRRPIPKHIANARLIAIGASTGGPEALRGILTQMPADAPCVVITQHIPALFSGTFASNLDAQCEMTVSEARDGEPLMRGHAYIAPGGQHLTVALAGSQGSERFQCRLTQHAPVNHHRPSVDLLFDSVAERVGKHAVGVLLTGMGKDGAKGLLKMRDSGAHTICQDESSSIVWGMPGAAVKLGAARQVLSLEQIGQELAGRLDCPSGAQPDAPVVVNHGADEHAIRY